MTVVDPVAQAPWPRLWAAASPRQRAALVAGSCVVFGGLAIWSIMAALTRAPYDRLADLHVYLGTVHATQAGLPIYDYQAGNGDPFTYPPFALLLFWPLGLLPEPTVQLLWTLASVTAVLAIAAAVTARAGVRGSQRFIVVTLAGAAILLMSAPLQSNLRFGQVSVFVVLLALVDALELLPRRLSGVLIGIAAAVKLTPLLFVPYLWYVGRRAAAMRALASFAAATAIAVAVWPRDSLTFWTKAVFTTSRIGDLASTGNQSVNGALLRYAVPTGPRMVAWAAIAVAVSVVAFLSAREAHRRGQVTQAAVVIGCATIAVSPVSWTHHQIWTVLAGVLLLAGPGRLRIYAGVTVVITMVLSLGAILPLHEAGPLGTFLGDNARGLCAVAVCVGGTAAIWRAGPARIRLLPGVALVGRPRTAVLYSAVLAGIAAAVLVAVSNKVVTAEVYTGLPDDRWATVVGDPCQGYQYDVDASGRAVAECVEIVGPLAGGMRLNFGSGQDRVDGLQTLVGEVAPEVARLVLVPIEGMAPIEVPLLQLRPLAATALPPQGLLGSPDKALPVIDRRVAGIRWFALATNDTSDGRLLAYDASGNVVADGGQKFRDP